MIFVLDDIILGVRYLFSLSMQDGLSLVSTHFCYAIYFMLPKQLATSSLIKLTPHNLQIFDMSISTVARLACAFVSLFLANTTATLFLGVNAMKIFVPIQCGMELVKFGPLPTCLLLYLG